MEKEIWKPIPGFVGMYSVSNLGRVKSFKMNQEKILKPMTARTQPYHKYALRKDNKPHYLLGHRLVAISFLDNPSDLPIVHHKDNNPKNNRLDNLEWVTYSENTIKAIEDGRFIQGFTGKDNPSLRFSDDNIRAMRDLRELGWTITEVCDLFGCSRAYVSELTNNKKRYLRANS